MNLILNCTLYRLGSNRVRANRVRSGSREAKARLAALITHCQLQGINQLTPRQGLGGRCRARGTTHPLRPPPRPRPPRRPQRRALWVALLPTRPPPPSPRRSPSPRRPSERTSRAPLEALSRATRTPPGRQPKQSAAPPPLAPLMLLLPLPICRRLTFIQHAPIPGVSLSVLFYCCLLVCTWFVDDKHILCSSLGHFNAHRLLYIKYIKKTFCYLYYDILNAPIIELGMIKKFDLQSLELRILLLEVSA